MANPITQLFGIRYPIIQAGMVWASGWRLASAVSNAGGLGLLGAGSMYPEVLREHIQKWKKATDKPFGVNVPLLYPDIDQLMEVIVEEKVSLVFTAAGNPKLWTAHLCTSCITYLFFSVNTFRVETTDDSSSFSCEPSERASRLFPLVAPFLFSPFFP